MLKKVLLVNPPVPDEKVWIREGRCQQWDIWGAPFPPFSLAMVSTQLVKGGYETRLIDSGPEHKNVDTVIKESVEFNPDVVIMTSTSPTIETDLNWFAGRVKATLPNAKIVAVGIHVTALSEQVLKRYPAVDYVVKGEPEVISRNLVDALAQEKPLSTVAGIAYRDVDDGHVCVGQEAGFVSDIDTLGRPDWEKINFKNYPMPIIQRPFSMISFSRGCPFSCKYCATHTYNGKKLRKRSIPALIEEIKYNLSLGVRDFLFWTELMTGDNRYLESFLDAILAEGLEKKIRWVCNSRVDGITDKLAQKMKKAGCWQMAFGFEFGNDEILQKALKGGKATVALGREAAEIVNRAGIAVDGHFILGYPGETEETMQQTIDFACSMPLTFAHFYACVPFPGTTLYREAVDNGWFDSDRWSSLNQDSASMFSGGLTPELVNEYIEKAYKRFYFNPKVMLRILRVPKSFKEYVEVFRLGFKFYASMKRTTCPMPEETAKTKEAASQSKYAEAHSG